MIIDEIHIRVKAGDGGNGAVSFRREKYVPKGGPDGGNGGDGGSIYFEGVSDLTALNQFRYKKEVVADKGGNGGKKKKDGKKSSDVYIKVPIGTAITNEETGYIQEITEPEQTILVARGGKGGLGSFDLRSPSNTTPLVAEGGRPGQEKKLFLNLHYIAEIGLIGLPNSGKSSLLNALTNTNAKIADYAFTTLEPNLGSMEGIIIADIPGLIEGAHTGKGLGIRFLKHIEKTSLLVHCIDIEAPDIKKNYEIIRLELENYNKELLKKKELIILTKSDNIDIKDIKEKMKIALKLNQNVITSSILEDSSISKVTSELKKFSSHT